MPVATVNGVNLAYVVKGGGAPLVAMHGFANSIYTWEPVMDALSRRIFRPSHTIIEATGGRASAKAPLRLRLWPKICSHS